LPGMQVTAEDVLNL